MLPNIGRFLRDDDFWWMAAAVVALLLLFAAAVDRARLLDFIKGFGRLVVEAAVRPVHYLAGVVQEMGQAEASGPVAPAEGQPSRWLDLLLRVARGALLVLVALALVTEGRAIWRTLTATESSAYLIPHTRSMLESARSRLAREDESLKRLQAGRAGMTPSPYGDSTDSQIRYTEQSKASAAREVDELEARLKNLEDKSWNWKAAARRTRDFVLGIVPLLWLCIYILEWTAMLNGVAKDVRAIRQAKTPAGG
jgi:hypothetical protein